MLSYIIDNTKTSEHFCRYTRIQVPNKPWAATSCYGRRKITFTAVELLQPPPVKTGDRSTFRQRRNKSKTRREGHGRHTQLITNATQHRVSFTKQDQHVLSYLYSLTVNTIIFIANCT